MYQLVQCLSLSFMNSIQLRAFIVFVPTYILPLLSLCLLAPIPIPTHSYTQYLVLGCQFLSFCLRLS